MEAANRDRTLRAHHDTQCIHLIYHRFFERATIIENYKKLHEELIQDRGVALPKHWHVLRSKIYKDQLLWYQLQEMGYEVFFPRLYFRTKSSKRVKIKPFFPGYLFFQVDFTVISISKFQAIPFVDHLICIEEKPLTVPEPMVQAIRWYVDTVNHSKGTSFEKPVGCNSEKDYVNLLVENGLLFEDGMSGSERVHILIVALAKIARSSRLKILDNA